MLQEGGLYLHLNICLTLFVFLTQIAENCITDVWLSLNWPPTQRQKPILRLQHSARFTYTHHFLFFFNLKDFTSSRGTESSPIIRPKAAQIPQQQNNKYFILQSEIPSGHFQHNCKKCQAGDTYFKCYVCNFQTDPAKYINFSGLKRFMLRIKKFCLQDHYCIMGHNIFPENRGTSHYLQLHLLHS